MNGAPRRVEPPEGHLLVGLLHRPHGIKGEISTELLSDNGERLAAGSNLWLSRGLTGRDRLTEEVTIADSRRHRGRWLITLEGFESREAADTLRSCVLSIPESEGIAKEGQVLVHKLVGLEVFSADGRRIGKIARVLDYPAQDILEIDTSNGVRLLPNVSALVSEISIEEGLVRLDASVDPDSFFDIDGGQAARSKRNGGN